MTERDEKKHRKNPQNFVTICSVIGGKMASFGKWYRERKVLEERVQLAIEQLGNPARPDIQDRLNKMHGLHFISLHVVKGEGRVEPSYLLLEMSVDGSKEDAIADLCRHMGEVLFPVYQLAKCVKSKSKFEYSLLTDSVEIMQSVWPEFYHGNRRNGLAFSGTAGLEVHNIHDDEVIANYAREIIDSVADGDANDANDKDTYLTPHKIFSRVQGAFDDKGLRMRVQSAWDDVCAQCETPNFAETSQAAWKKAWSIPTLINKAVPGAVFAHIGLVFLGIASLVWIALNGGPNETESLAHHISQITDGNPGFYFSPEFMLTGFLISLLAAIIIDTLISRFNRPGAVFWFTGTFAVFFGLMKYGTPRTKRIGRIFACGIGLLMSSLS